MNIVYLLTNKTKTSGRRFYVGSKVECKLIQINGVDTIWNVKTGHPYYSSSKNFEFLEDMRNGHIFEAKILEIVKKREDIRDVENKFIRQFNAVASDEFYNQSEAFQNTYAHTAVRNMFGETVAEYASRASQVSKRDGTARELGYKNFGELYFAIQERLDGGEKTKDISSSFNRHRKWVQITLEPYDMQKAKLDLLHDKSVEIRDMMRNGASLKLAADKLGIELPAARVMLGDFAKEGEKSFSVALERGLSKEEFEIEVTERILNGEGFIDICNSTTLCRESVLRYFLRCLRSNKENIIEILRRN